MLLLVAVVLLASSVTQGQTDFDYETHRHEDDDLNVMQVHSHSGDIYIGGRNKIMRLDGESLGVLNRNQTQLTDGLSTTNGIVIDYKRDNIIHCETGLQGLCFLRRASDLKLQSCGRFPACGNISPSSLSTPFLMNLVQKNDWDILYTARTVNEGENTLFGQSKVGIAVRNPTRLSQATDYLKPVKDSNFRIDYKFSFSYSHFAYWVTVQKQSLNSEEYVTHIGRRCHDDPKFFSYVQARLLCEDADGQPLNLATAATVLKTGRALGQLIELPDEESILYVAFHRPYDKNNPDSLEPVGGVCRYSLRKLNRELDNAVIRCLGRGLGNHGPDYLSKAMSCRKKSGFDARSDDWMCGKHMAHPTNENKHFFSFYPMTEKAVVTWDEDVVSTMAGSLAGDFPVLSLGTKEGRLLKASVLEDGRVFERHDLDLKYPVLQLATSLDDQHLYILQTNSLARWRVQQCNQHTSCTTCLSSANPYCGWCTLEQRCTVQTECKPVRKNVEERRWLAYTQHSCPTVSQITPNKTYPRSARRLMLELQAIPTGLDLQCRLNSHTLLSAEQIKEHRSATTGLYCPLPNSLWRNVVIPATEDSASVSVSVLSKDVVLTSANFTVYDCKRHTSCTSCVTSENPCRWCVVNNVCGNVATDCTSSDTQRTSDIVSSSWPIVPGASNILRGDNVEDNCPRIEPKENAVISIPAGSEHSLTIRAVRLQRVHPHDFTAVLEFPDHVKRVSCRVRNSIVECDKVKFDYSGNVGQKKVVLRMQYDGKYFLDNPKNIQIEMYKCDLMVNSCGECLLLPDRYNCGYCEASKACVLRSKCPNPLGSSDHCRNPKLKNVSPLRGPTAGGTLITVTGENLGRDTKNYKSFVLVGGQPCHTVSFEPIKSVTCRTPETTVAGPALIEVITGEVKNVYPEKFIYVEPELLSAKPAVGLVTGGTTLTLTGSHFRSGSKISVQLRERSGRVYNCSVMLDRQTDSSVSCMTPMLSENLSPMDIIVQLDDDTLSLPSAFSAARLPHVELANAWTFNGGGVSMTIHGSEFHLLQTPLMYIERTIDRRKQLSFSPCVVLDDTRLLCQTPPIPRDTTVHSAVRREVLTVSYGLQPSHKSLHGRQAIGVLQVYPNPVFTPFEQQPMTYRPSNPEIVLQGRNLLPLRPGDVTISLGLANCNFTSVSKSGTRLSCRPPPHQPDPRPGYTLPHVVVRVGSRLNYTIGALRYESAKDPGNTSKILSIVIPCVFGVILVFVVSFIGFYRRKSAKSVRHIKNLQNRIDRYEKQVKDECKDAFTELQTDNPELSSDMPTHLPWRDFRSYCMQSMFPAATRDHHPVLNRQSVIDVVPSPGTMDEPVLRFKDLLLEEEFFISWIQAMEMSRDKLAKKQLTSLLSVALLPNMQYFTRVLRRLLRTLIEENVAAGSQMHLFRRNETVTENLLSNWICVLLYDHLRESAGMPLYRLFRAVKQQAYKGPVDQLTGEARYSLSEEKLLPKKIVYNCLTVRVPDANNMYASAEQPQYNTEVKVLDCDTISQVKDKILDTLFRSLIERPDKDTLDLEWQTSKYAKTILMDKDIKTSNEGPFKKLNTLATYSVQNGACLALVPRHNQDTSILSNASFGAAHSGAYAIPNTSSVSAASKAGPNGSRYENVLYQAIGNNDTVTINGNSLLNDNSTYYHLVKPDGPSSDEPERRSSGCTLCCSKAERDTARGGGDRMVSEIYLSRLSLTKGTLQPFVDSLIETIFPEPSRAESSPLCLRYLFRVFDDEASRLNIAGAELLHVWKSNSIPQRFWATIIRNPEHLFHVNKSTVVDSCLSVISTMLMDSCSYSDNQLSRDSPPSKLLYNKEVRRYRGDVKAYYEYTRQLPASEHEMDELLQRLSHEHGTDFDTHAAVKELLDITKQRRTTIYDSMSEAHKARLSPLLDEQD